MIKTNFIFKDKLIILLLLLCLLLSCFYNFGPMISVHAESNFSTLVLEDLQKDSNFNIENYPSVKGDYSIKLIQIAETINKELLVYLYIPCAETKELEPTTISISDLIVDLENPSFNLYNLTLQNSNGVFYKYKVEGLQVKGTATRRYNISEIHRKFDSTIDNTSDNGNITTEVACPVAQNWTAYTDEIGKTYYKYSTSEVVTIINKYVGFVRYETGLNGIYKYCCDNYFIAFSCDYDIDNLVSADVYYQSQYIKWNGKNYTYEKIEDKLSNLYADVKQEWEGVGTIWQKPTYSWKEIQSTEEFLVAVDLNNTYDCGLFSVSTETKINEESKVNIRNNQWVLRFANPEYMEKSLGTSDPLPLGHKTIISNVSILRLEFEIDSKIYNLGVIDNKVTPSEEPDIVTKSETNLAPWLATLIKGLLVTLAVIILILILVFVGFLIYLPIKLIITLVKM